MKDPDLENFIHQTLRSLPDRPAPRSLESRVLAAIEARAALPWWKQSFAQWPVAARFVWLYGIIAVVAGSYAMLFSLGATAYRALYSHR